MTYPMTYLQETDRYGIWSTSSTAQGGGGNFKNRKPIGEVRCCESRMAERTDWWTERWLECRSIHPSIHLSIHPFVCLSAYLSICLFIYPSIYLSTYPSSCLSTYTYLSVYLPIHLFVFPSICFALYLSMQPSIHQTACLCVYLSIYLSFDFSFSRSVHFLVYLSVFPLVFRSIHLSSCLSAHPAIHSIHSVRHMNRAENRPLPPTSWFACSCLYSPTKCWLKSILPSTCQKRHGGQATPRETREQGSLRHRQSDRCRAAENLRSETTHTRLFCWEINTSEKTQSAAFTYGRGAQTLFLASTSAFT